MPSVVARVQHGDVSPPDPTSPPPVSPDVTTGTPARIFAPFLGWMPRGTWQPIEPGPQPYNRGLDPRYRRDRRSARRCHLVERLADAEVALGEALARLAALEGAARG